MFRLDLRALLVRFIRRGIAQATPGAIAAPGAAEPPLQRLPKSYQDAAQSLVDMPLVQSAAFKRKLVYDRVPQMDAGFWAFVLKLQKELHRRGMAFYVHTAFRTHAEQAVLFKRGVTRARPGQSAHNHGFAADLVLYGKEWQISPTQWAVVGLIGKEVARKCGLKVEWGGDWSFYDPAHWEVKGWRERV